MSTPTLDQVRDSVKLQLAAAGWSRYRLENHPGITCKPTTVRRFILGGNIYYENLIQIMEALGLRFVIESVPQQQTHGSSGNKNTVGAPSKSP